MLVRQLARDRDIRIQPKVSLSAQRSALAPTGSRSQRQECLRHIGDTNLFAMHLWTDMSSPSRSTGYHYLWEKRTLPLADGVVFSHHLRHAVEDSLRSVESDTLCTRGHFVVGKNDGSFFTFHICSMTLNLGFLVEITLNTTRRTAPSVWF